MADTPQNWTFLNDNHMNVAGGNGTLVPTQNTKPVADPLCCEDLKFTFNLFDPITQSIQASEAHALVTNDEYVSNPPYDDEGFQALVAYLLLNNNPDLSLIADQSTSVPYNLISGYNSFQTGTITTFSIQLNQPTDSVDKWYGSTDFANYGYCCFGTKENPVYPPLNPIAHINLPLSGYALQQGHYSGITVFLKKGITGQMFSYNRLSSVSNATFTNAGGGGTFPLNAQAFLPPGPG